MENLTVWWGKKEFVLTNQTTIQSKMLEQKIVKNRQIGFYYFMKKHFLSQNKLHNVKCLILIRVWYNIKWLQEVL